ncbi:transglutaminase domain-containing protein [candidate division KSB1 bacterium]|nr:transglutaminase domain-containing protein [candidate division KSB1 bacterium]
MFRSHENQLEQYLLPTKLINTQHPDIQRKVMELTRDCETVVARARNIFYFIRDDIRYEFRGKFKAEQYLASYILQDGKGFCTQKAILFCALARCAGIPAGLYFFDIIDHTLPEQMVRLMKTRTLFHHGIVMLCLNGEWHKYDATLHSQLVERNQLIPVEFSPHRDCLMSQTTRHGTRHIDYIRDYGIHADVSFEQITGWFREGYPHIAERYATKADTPDSSTHSPRNP